MAIMMINRLEAMLKVNKISSSQGGSGRTSMAMMSNTNAGMLSPEKLKLLRFCRILDSVSVVMGRYS